MAKKSLAALVLLLLSPQAPLAADNLLSNGEFDVSLQVTGWSSTATSWGWDPFDSDLCIGSGALTGTSSGLNMSLDPEDCLAVAAGETAYIALRYKSSALYTRVYLRTYADSGCTQTPMNYGPLEIGDPTGDWSDLETFGTLPAGTAAFQLHLEGASNSAFTLSVDRVHVGLLPPIFSDDFEGMQRCRWSDEAP